MTPQDAHGTAREINPSPDMVTLSKEVEEVATRLHAEAHFSSGCIETAELCERAADLLTRISAERDRLEGERDALLPDDPWHWKNRAIKAESERDALKAERDAVADWGRTVHAAMHDKLSALKATINELALEHPFTPAQWARLHATLTGEQK